MAYRTLEPYDASSPITTFTLFKFATGQKWWAFGQMGQRLLQDPPGATFGRMLGCGRNGFDLTPDFGQYVFLAQWKNDRQADAFFASPLFCDYVARASAHDTIKMVPLQAHGQWDGTEPFPVSHRARQASKGPVVVLTRAKINLGKLWDFWRHVPKAHASLARSEGALLAMGIGENPVTQQATISVWDSVSSLKKFAYQQPGHKEIVQKTRQRGWYQEELFARFKPVAVEGFFGGRLTGEGWNG